MTPFKPLPRALAKKVCALMELREIHSRYARELEGPARVLQAFQRCKSNALVPAKPQGPSKVEKALRATATRLEAEVEDFREHVKTAARDYFAKLGISTGTAVKLHYPVYKFCLDEELEARREITGYKTSLMRVEHFTVIRARSLDDVALGFCGVVKSAAARGHKWSTSAETIEVGPECSFEVLTLPLAAKAPA